MTHGHDQGGEVTADDAELRWLIDRTKILELTARYNRCYDEGDAEAFADLFTDDGVMDVEGGFRVEGREGLVQMCAHMPWGIMHVTTDAIVEVHGDTATQRLTLMVLRRAGADGEGSVSTLTTSGRYTDDLVRTADGWRFKTRRAVLDGGLGG
jgi:uncharacterized protein (TIGR02246 family)